VFGENFCLEFSVGYSDEDAKNNRGLQATYADLGIAEADVVQAGRLRNPGFSFARLRRTDEVEIERTFLFDLLGLLTMPVRTELERRRFELTKGRVTAEVLQLAADTRRAWHRAVSARESVKYAEQVKEAAEASADLARRMAAAGNFSKLDHAREQVFYAEATAQLARARQTSSTRRTSSPAPDQKLPSVDFESSPKACTAFEPPRSAQPPPSRHSPPGTPAAESACPQAAPGLGRASRDHPVAGRRRETKTARRSTRVRAKRSNCVEVMQLGSMKGPICRRDSETFARHHAIDRLEPLAIY
jgi:Outer membrane efflux protein